MPKTLIIADSAADISFQQEREWGIKVLNIPIAIEGKPYRDREDIDGAEFVRNLDGYKELPKTSQIAMFEYYEAYLEAAKAGYDEIITITINAGGSGCYSNAMHAIEALSAENPEYAEKVTVHVVDGGSYTLAVAWPIPRAVAMLGDGKPAAEVAAYLRDLYSHQITLIGLTNLKYAKHSGRLSATTAVVGDALGIKPIIGVHDGENHVLDKCRGEKNIIPKIVELYKREAADITGDYAVAYGMDPSLAEELVAELTKVAGHGPEAVDAIGPLIALNSGPRIVGMAFRRK